MTITLEAIKNEQTKLADMIAAFEAQAKRLIHFPETEIQLRDGEHYAGIILGKDGAPNHHLILLPGEVAKAKWAAAKEFAAKVGGELPTRREQSLLFANLKEQFQEAYYWSGEQHASYAGCAWCQYFNYGYQGYDVISLELRARAVRRLVIL
ncbi:MAG TPA: hypothetical protein DIT28_09955 [Oxalobacteraceae bacterium]|nr:hypothetical protein [Oxalobacteraceae bacterium]